MPTRLCGGPGLLLLGLLLGGCAPSFMQQNDQQVRHAYVLEWQVPRPAAPANAKGPALTISPMGTSPGYNVADMAYQREAHRIEYFAHHHWVEDPARMLEPLLVDAAVHSGLFRSVAEAASRTHAELRLDSTLLKLCQLDRGDAGELELALRVRLVDVARAEILGSRVLRVSIPLAERTPAAGVHAANLGVARLLDELQAFLVTQLRDFP